jgi:hypothetical protein
LTIGPRVTDADFFGALLDTDRPGLQGIPAVVARGDYAAARQMFAAEVRRTLQPERFLSIERVFRGNHFMRPGERVAEAAERILRLELISCSTPHQFVGEVDWFANPTFNQYREWTWQLSRHPEWAVLAEQYRATGDERYAAGFVRLFQSWVCQAVAPDDDIPGNHTLCWRTIEAGIRMGGSWQWALHSFCRSPYVTDDVLVDWYKSIYEHGRRLRLNHRTHNWLIMEMNGLAQIGILYPQLRDAPDWRTYAFARLVEELDRQLYPDGLQYELSTNYHQVNINNYQWLCDVCRAYDVPVPAAFYDGLERMHAANVLLMMPDGRLPDLNDGRWYPVAPIVRRAAEIFSERDDFRWAATEGRDGRPPAATSHAFGYGGYIVLRSSWDPDAIWALFDGGPFGYAHQHEDKLNLLLHAYGRLLLTEGGNYAYDSSEMRRYVLSTRAHNTIRVDGQDQNRRLHHRGDMSWERREALRAAGSALQPRAEPEGLEDLLTTPCGARWRFIPAFDAVTAVYDEGYGPTAARSVRHDRRVIFLKPRAGTTVGPLLLVVDRLLPLDSAEHAYEVLWHLAGERAVAAGLTAASDDQGMPNLTIVASRVSSLELSLVAGQEFPEWQGWKGIKDHQQGEYAPAPTARYTWRAAGPSRLATLLYPTRPGERCPVVAVEADSDPDATGVRLRIDDGRVIDLDESDFVLDLE